MSFCKKCGNKVKEGIKHCTKCGDKIEKGKKHIEANNKCPKCHAELLKDATFCGECGHKLTKHKETQKETEKDQTPKSIKSHKIAPWTIPWIVIGVLLVTSGVILLPTKVVSYQIEVPYIDKETYTVQVPYEDIEEYTVQVTEEVKKPVVESIRVEEKEKLKYTIENEDCSSSNFLISGKSSYKLTNLDDDAGIFTVEVGIVDNSGNFISDTKSVRINPTNSFTYTYSPTPTSSEFTGCRYRIVSLPEKINVEYRDVIKEETELVTKPETRYRKVTKTRTDTKEREVRKTRTETKQKEINWLFGFDAIIKFRNLK